MATIGLLLHQMFPNGTRSDEADSWDKIPLWPIDIFAFVAKLVDISGAYQHVVVRPGYGNQNPFGLEDDDWPEKRDGVAKAVAWGMIQHRLSSNPLSAAELTYCEEALKKEAFEIVIGCELNFLLDAWKAIYDAWDDRISPNLGLNDVDNYESPEWAKAAIRLMIIMDHACLGVGFYPRPMNGQTIALNWVSGKIIGLLTGINQAQGGSGDSKDADLDYATTLTSDFFTPVGAETDPLSVFDSHLCAVLPKTRTSTVGCTIRSMTHHLALLPSSNEVEARWRFPACRPPAAYSHDDPSKNRGLNILVIPFPYRINSPDFCPKSQKDGWGFYDIEQNWLRTSSPDSSTREPEKLFSDFVISLIKRARRDIGEINGIIFPELSLNAKYFSHLSEKLREQFVDHEKNDPNQSTGFEFIVSGLSEELSDISPSAKSNGAKPRSGNFVSFLGIQREEKEDGSVGYIETHLKEKKWSIRGSREKHHRWKLNSQQIERYGLSSRLDPKLSWWENISLSKRIVEFYQLRSGTSTTILICEDLARADPVQSVLRSIGPNLVIAILMDGPQRPYRWAGHYAGSLADDPGSSVLTLTSFGLIERGAAVDSSHSRSIGYFKGSYGKNEQELQLPVGAHALALRLEAGNREEHTLDQRSDGGSAYVWRLADVCPVAGHIENNNIWITGVGS